ncbi:unnamed protein product [Knipowitschia caucasica]
MDFRNQGILNN